MYLGTFSSVVGEGYTNGISNVTINTSKNIFSLQKKTVHFFNKSKKLRKPSLLHCVLSKLWMILEFIGVCLKAVHWMSVKIRAPQKLKLICKSQQTNVYFRKYHPSRNNQIELQKMNRLRTTKGTEAFI